MTAFAKWLSDPQLFHSGQERGAAKMGYYEALAEVEKMVMTEYKSKEEWVKKRDINLEKEQMLYYSGQTTALVNLLSAIRAMKEGTK